MFFLCLENEKMYRKNRDLIGWPQEPMYRAFAVDLLDLWFAIWSMEEQNITFLQVWANGRQSDQGFSLKIHRVKSAGTSIEDEQPVSVEGRQRRNSHSERLGYFLPRCDSLLQERVIACDQPIRICQPD